MTGPVRRGIRSIAGEPNAVPPVVVGGGLDLLTQYGMAILPGAAMLWIPLVARGGGVGAVGAQEQGQGEADHCSSSYRSYRSGKGGILGLREPHWPYAMQGSLTMG